MRPEEPVDTWQCGFECSSDFPSPEVPRDQYEYTGAASAQRGDFQGSIAEPLVLYQDNPGARAYRGEQDVLRFVAFEATYRQRRQFQAASQRMASSMD